jgi:transposase-like protein
MIQAIGVAAMAQSVLSEDRFQNEDAALAHVESLLWPNGPICSHCGNCDSQRITKMAGKTTRKGLYNCKDCRKPFTVRVGTVFESSHLPLHLWLQIIHLMCAGKKGVSTNQVQRMLSCSMKTAWFLTHRIREAMRIGDIAPMGGAGGIVEIDETYIGRKDGFEVKRGSGHKNVVLTLVERDGKARSFHVEKASKDVIIPIVRENIDRESHVMTDEAPIYSKLGNDFSRHGAVEHSRDEYGYLDRETGANINTNTVEGFYSIFKRGMFGVYQHCSEQHLHRYLAEFDFRYSNRIKLGVTDASRAERALRGVKGKRLTYETTTQN